MLKELIARKQIIQLLNILLRALIEPGSLNRPPRLLLI